MDSDCQNTEVDLRGDYTQEIIQNALEYCYVENKSNLVML